MDQVFCMQLDQEHAYYYQIQTQLHMRDIDLCDFVLCTFSQSEAGDEEKDLHIECITKTFWSECVPKPE